MLHTEADGTVTGYATYRLTGREDERSDPESTLTVEEVRGRHAGRLRRAVAVPASPTTWCAPSRRPRCSVDDPVRHLLADPRAWRARPTDALWVRLVDVGAALSARRYPARLDMVFEVRDRFCDWNDGRWHVWGHPAGAFCDRTDRDPDLVLDIEALSAVYLGGESLATLQAAGRVTEISPGAVTQAATAFRWPVTPWCPDSF